MTEWTTHTPAFDGDAPEGVGLDTHYIMCEIEPARWMDCDQGVFWGSDAVYRFMPRQSIIPMAMKSTLESCVKDFASAIQHGDDEHCAWLAEAADAWLNGLPLPPAKGKGVTATYAQVKVYCEQHGHPVPPKPVNYEAWENALQAHYDAYEGGVVATPPDIEDRKNIDSIIAAMRIAINSPACMEDVKG